ncbi:MAG: LacI family DNA-binding transcriptional regulator [Actinomycetota bacterium]|nr:LacI family DNA-binding transcriptional regulator [Actinomycetota bacterium]
MTTHPTIADVARAAGVSVTTVSHALNDKGRVDPETRERIAQVVARLGYRANRHARGLRSGRSGSIALLLPLGLDASTDEVLSLDFYLKIASVAAATAFAREQALMLLPPTITTTGLRGLAVDGGIVVDPSPLDPRVSLLRDLDLPVVTVERDLGRPGDASYVATHAEANTRIILDHLAARGARRIALLAPLSDWGWVTESVGAYRSWTAERGLPELIVPVAMRPGEQSAYDATTRLLASDPPDAVLPLAARFVRGTLRAARVAGCRVPGDVLIAAGVDCADARDGDPPVTALDLHPELQAAAAVEMLLGLIDGTPSPAPRHVSATLRMRASTGGRPTD